MGEITKKQNFGCLSNCRYYVDRAQNLPGPAPNNVLTVLQISSKSGHLRRSYSRTDEHRFLPRRVFPWFARSYCCSCHSEDAEKTKTNALLQLSVQDQCLVLPVNGVNTICVVGRGATSETSTEHSSKHTCWRRRTRLEKLLIVVIAVLFVILVIVISVAAAYSGISAISSRASLSIAVVP